MTPVFVDTFFFLALLNKDDRSHPEAVHWADRVGGRLVTTSWVLVETANALSSPARRARFGLLMDFVRSQEGIRVVDAAQPLFEEGTELYLSRDDKAWSLTDCISFVVMRREGLQDALTADHHFDQAGFHTLMGNKA